MLKNIRKVAAAGRLLRRKRNAFGYVTGRALRKRKRQRSGWRRGSRRQSLLRTWRLMFCKMAELHIL